MPSVDPTQWHSKTDHTHTHTKPIKITKKLSSDHFHFYFVIVIQGNGLACKVEVKVIWQTTEQQTDGGPSWFWLLAQGSAHGRGGQCRRRRSRYTFITGQLCFNTVGLNSQRSSRVHSKKPVEGSGRDIVHRSIIYVTG